MGLGPRPRSGHGQRQLREDRTPSGSGSGDGGVSPHRPSAAWLCSQPQRCRRAKPLPALLVTRCPIFRLTALGSTSTKPYFACSHSPWGRKRGAEMLSARGGLSRARPPPAAVPARCPAPGRAATAVSVPRLPRRLLPPSLPPPPSSPAQNPPLPFPRRPSQAAQGDFTTLIPGNC